MASLPPAPTASSPAVRAVMRGNRAAETSPEVALRSALHRMGLRFRKNVSPQPGIRCRADVVFRSERVAVFVDGCYWHRCPIHGVMPSVNREYWEAKLDRNVLRDRRNDTDLRSAGWTVARVWEHEPAAEAATRVADIVLRHRVERQLPGSD